jgi:tRNA pseudouridine38-40 synthase
VRYRATLAYDGSAYWGFQRQAGDAQTVQKAVEDAICRMTGKTVTVVGAGRTDTGVHATGQVISFDIEGWSHGPNKLVKALNAALPPDIRLRDAAEAPGFHPRFDATSRRYRYTVMRADVPNPLLNGRAWTIDRRLDLEVMQSAAQMLVGAHDFATFGHPPQGDNTVRVVFMSEWTQRPDPWGELFEYVVEATAFLHHQVRRMVGMMVELGQGRLDLCEFESRFCAADIHQAKRAAPPQGLILEAVRYRE